MNRVLTSPGAYIQGPGVMLTLGAQAARLGARQVFAIVDDALYDTLRGQIESSFQACPVGLYETRFSGECTRGAVVSMTKQAMETGADLVMGVGGGKTLDLAKATAHYLEAPIVIVPTAASTDAPCSGISVLYTENGVFDSYLHLRRNPDLIAVDSTVIANAPCRLLAAGMGDALSTYFEARACFRSGAPTNAGGVCSVTALQLGKACMETLYADGVAALEAVKSHQVTSPLQNIIEANLYLSGVGFESGGLACAHAIHDGLTILPESGRSLHGEKVAFGTLVQLILEQAPLEELKRAQTFARQVGLPVTLEELGVPLGQCAKIAEAACKRDSMHHMPFQVTEEQVAHAIETADQMGTRA